MKNVLEYYYNLSPKEIHQKNEEYSFNINNNKYLLCQYKGNTENLKEIYNLHLYVESIGIYCHKIILNNNGKIATIINDNLYILLNIGIENRIINIKDIIKLSNSVINNAKSTKLKRDNWSKLWSEKIDFMEYQINQIRKEYPNINYSIDYYIGIVENCIQMMNNFAKNNINSVSTIMHRRINMNTTVEEFYNPLEFIIDDRVRDISEYIKSLMEKQIDIIPYLEQYIYNTKLSHDEIRKLFIRIMYPSIYLDKVEEIINNKKKEITLVKFLKDIQKSENNIINLYNYLNKISSMPDVEWIKKVL